MLDDDDLARRLGGAVLGRERGLVGFDVDLVVVDDEEARVVGRVVGQVVLALGLIGDPENAVDRRIVEVVPLLGRHVLLRERGHQLVEHGVGDLLGLVALPRLVGRSGRVAHSATPSR